MNQLAKVKASIALVVLLTLSLLALINWDIVKREAWLANGEVVRLALAPVDPRSLMQGDYMVLNYSILTSINSALAAESANGYVRVGRDADLLGQFVALETSLTPDKPLLANELLLQFRVRDRQVKLATNGYFFQEGQGEHFDAAQYGEFRVNEHGELLLDALLDKDLQRL